MKTGVRIEGMHCKSCEMLITDILEDHGATIIFNKDKATITHEIPFKEIKGDLEKEGYKVHEI